MKRGINNIELEAELLQAYGRAYFQESCIVLGNL